MSILAEYLSKAQDALGDLRGARTVNVSVDDWSHRNGIEQTKWRIFVLPGVGENRAPDCDYSDFYGDTFEAVLEQLVEAVKEGGES